jgi:hypothetical protein
LWAPRLSPPTVLPPLLILLLLPQLGAPTVTPREGPVSLPPGSVAELLEAVDLDGPRATLDLAWPDWSDRGPDGWGAEAPWRHWVELVRDEASAATPDPRRRAQLAALARAQGRDADAWRHLVACRAEPPIVAALFPLFLPGVPASVLAGGEPWPEDVLLCPALPPSDDPRGGLRALHRLSLTHAGFRVGGATIDLSLRIDGDGAGVTLHHLQGPPVRVRARPPLPGGVDAGLLFVDWERTDADATLPGLTLDAEDPEHSVWLTFHRPRSRWPTPREPRIGPGRTLVVVDPEGDPALRRSAEALGELLGMPAQVVGERPTTGTGLEPLVLAFDEPAARERKWVAMLGQAERLALSSGSR